MTDDQNILRERAIQARTIDREHRLILAAEDMYEALLDCREALERAGAYGELRVVDRAIAKARGEQIVFIGGEW